MVLQFCMGIAKISVPRIFCQRNTYLFSRLTVAPLSPGVILSSHPEYFVDEHNVELDPNKTMQFMQAGISAWPDDVAPTTIANRCPQARVLGPDYRPLTESQAKRAGKKATICCVSGKKLFFVYHSNKYIF